MPAATNYDVVICGGGLAGLTLARQLKLELPELSVALIDRLPRPLPEAAHKVGESSVEVSSHYFGEILGLKEYFRQRQLPKLGLRFFFGDPQGPFEDRPEFGNKLFPPVPSYQIDRGRIENDLRDMAAQMGVAVFEDTQVDNIILAEDSTQRQAAFDAAPPHTVLCRRHEQAEPLKLRGRWVVDALGRRRLIQSKLGLKLPNGHSAGAAWWRINARLNVTDLGVRASRSWRRRNIDDRYYSTNHLVARGYWLWFIPLSSGTTSVGIVTDETIHPLRTYGESYAQALEWIRKYEPAALQLVEGHEPLDFLTRKNYSYHSKQIFSHRRWSCVGEAGMFLDPLYSPGSDYIAMTNTITVEMIRRDLRGELSEAAVDEFNSLVLDGLGRISLAYYKNAYCTLGHAQVYSAKFAWDTAIYWAMLSQVFFQGIIRRPTPEVLELARRYRDLNERVQRLFIDWSEKAPSRSPFVSQVDMTRMPFLQLLHLDLTTRRTTAEFLEVARLNLDRFEELAVALFWQAVAECLPEHSPKERGDPPWVNAWRISLDPERWEADGLFAPWSAPRRLQPMRSNLAGVFGPMTWRERLRVDLPYQLFYLARGKLFPAMVRFLNRKLMRDRPALWVRRLFVTDQPARPCAANASSAPPQVDNATAAAR